MATTAASPPTSIVVGESHDMTVDVEEWLNREFGENMEVGGETTELTQVDEYINVAEFMLEQQAASSSFAFFVPLDEGLFYEPDLWTFT